MNFYNWIKKSPSFKIKELTNEAALDILHNNCLKNVYKYVDINTRMYYWTYGHGDVLLIDSTNINRLSAAIHHPIVNEHLSWSKFPKRNIICSSREYQDFNDNKQVYLVFPFDNTKIGECPESNIDSSWNVLRKTSGLNFGSYDFDENIIMILMTYYNEKTISSGFDDLKHLKNICSKYKKEDFLNIFNNNEKDIDISDKFIKLVGSHFNDDETLYDFIIKIYNPKNFDVITYLDIQNNPKKELWFDGKAILIKYDVKETKEIIKKIYDMTEYR